MFFNDHSLFAFIRRGVLIDAGVLIFTQKDRHGHD